MKRAEVVVVLLALRIAADRSRTWPNDHRTSYAAAAAVADDVEKEVPTVALLLRMMMVVEEVVALVVVMLWAVAGAAPCSGTD